MRLFLVPISARRTLVYAQRLNKVTRPQPSRADRLAAKASQKWLEWEKSKNSWQRWITEKGNALFDRIPYEEWGLKSIPPLSARRKQEEIEGKLIEVVYPPSIINGKSISTILQRLGTERNKLHRQRLMGCMIAMPITAPIGILPLVPNIPFFYFLYRAFSHWKALLGAKHLEFLVNNKAFTPSPSAALDDVYSRRAMAAIVDHELLTNEAKVVWREADATRKDGKAGMNLLTDKLLIKPQDAKDIATAINVPSLAVETERAARQVADHLRLEAEKLAQEVRLQQAGETAKKAA